MARCAIRWHGVLELWAWHADLWAASDICTKLSLTVRMAHTFPEGGVSTSGPTACFLLMSCSCMVCHSAFIHNALILSLDLLRYRREAKHADRCSVLGEPSAVSHWGLHASHICNFVLSWAKIA